jgi:hypothetical protein
VKRSFVLALVVAALLADSAEGNTFRVTRTDDPAPGPCRPGDCSLREATLAANRAPGKDVIELRSGANYSLERAGDSDRAGDLDVQNGVAIRAAERRPAQIDGRGLERALEFKGPGKSSVARVIVLGGSDEAVRITERTTSDDPGAVLLLRRSRVSRSESQGIFGYNARLGVPGGRVILARSYLFNNGTGVRARRVTMRNSRVSRNTEFGGVFACDRLWMTRSVVLDNTVDGDDAGGVQIGDDQNSDPDCIGYRFRIRNSLIAGNTSTGGSGGIDTGNAGGRGTITGSRVNHNEGRLTGGMNLAFADVSVRNTTVRMNSGAREAGGVTAHDLHIADSSIERNVGVIGGLDVFDLRMARSTVSGNRAAEDGGGIRANRASIVNSTIADNAADGDGGGIALSGARGEGLTSSTVVRNRADADGAGGGEGGGLARLGARPWPVRNSLVGLNVVSGPDPDAQCSGTFSATGHNLLSANDPGCSGLGGSGDLVRSDPKVGSLADHGGRTDTVSLRPGSPAVGAAARRGSPDIDQRRVPRDRRPDIGAFERR